MVGSDDEGRSMAKLKIRVVAKSGRRDYPAPQDDFRLAGLYHHHHHLRRAQSQTPSHFTILSTHTHASSGAASKMSLLRTSRLITNSRARLQIVPNLSAARAQQQRPISSTTALRAGDAHAHEDHYDTPTGNLWGVKQGEKYENEGWENVWYYGFFGSCLFGLVGYCYKPDTR